MYVFVYGSLLSGLSNHHVMRTAKGVFIGAAKTIGSFYLTARGDKQYPYLTSTALSSQQIHNRITGEIYEIEDDVGLSVLDELEEYPMYYNRHIIDIQKSNSSSSCVHVTTTTNETIQCYAYFLESQSVLDKIRNEFGTGFFDVPDGDWKQYLSTK